MVTPSDEESVNPVPDGHTDRPGIVASPNDGIKVVDRIIDDVIHAAKVRRQKAEIDRDTNRYVRQDRMHALQQKAWLILFGLAMFGLVIGNLWAIWIFANDGTATQKEWAWRFVDVTLEAAVAGFIAFLAIRKFEGE